jgi:hypothetical protein
MTFELVNCSEAEDSGLLGCDIISHHRVVASSDSEECASTFNSQAVQEAQLTSMDYLTLENIVNHSPVTECPMSAVLNCEQHCWKDLISDIVIQYLYITYCNCIQSYCQHLPSVLQHTCSNIFHVTIILLYLVCTC